MKSEILNMKQSQMISKTEKKDKKKMISSQIIEQQNQSSHSNIEDSLFNKRKKKNKILNEPSMNGNSKIENSKIENSKNENSKNENSKNENSKNENLKIENSKNENSKIENSKIENSKIEKDSHLIEKNSNSNQSKSSITTSNNDDESIYSDDSQLNPQEIQFKKAYYLGNIALRLNDPEEAIHYADDLVLFSNSALTKDQMRIFLGCNYIYIEKLRNAHRILCNLLLNDNSSKKLIQEIKSEKERLILKRCERVIKLINENLLINKLNNEETAKYLKVKGDYYRYMAEITTGHSLFINKQNAFHFYNEAKDLVKNLDDLNPTKLNISLNYSVFLNEILNMRINSFFYAKEALYNALKSLKNCSEEILTSEEMKDTLMIIETLNNNVEDWYKEEVGDIFDTEEKLKKENEKKEKLEKKKKKEIKTKKTEKIESEETKEKDINTNKKDNNLSSSINNKKSLILSQVFQNSQKS